MRNFAATLDALLLLFDSIRDAIRAAISRTMEVADQCQVGQSDPTTPLIYHFLAHNFQRAIARAYGLVRGGKATAPSDVVAAIKKFPDTGVFSSFIAELHSIRSTHALPTYMLDMATPQVGAAPAADPNAGGKTKKQTPPKVDARRMCCFWNTAEGCKKTDGECSGLHRRPESDKERGELEKFFKRYRKLNPKA